MLLELVEPFVAALDPRKLTKERLEALLGVAQLVWNTEQLDNGGELREGALRDLDGLGSDPEVTRHLVRVILKRRRLLFPADRRIVTGVYVLDGSEPGSFQVSATHVARPPKT